MDFRMPFKSSFLINYTHLCNHWPHWLIDTRSCVTFNGMTSLYATCSAPSTDDIHGQRFVSAIDECTYFQSYRISTFTLLISRHIVTLRNHTSNFFKWTTWNVELTVIVIIILHVYQAVYTCVQTCTVFRRHWGWEKKKQFFIKTI